MKYSIISGLVKIYVTDSIETIYISNDYGTLLRNTLITEPVESIYDFIKHNADRLQHVSTSNIPQFGDIDLIPKVIDIVNNSKELHGFSDIGSFLTCPTAKYDAKRKYGENHYKLAAQLGLTKNTTKGFALTQVGKIYSNESPGDKELLMKKLILRIPIIQQILLQAEEGPVDLTGFLGEYLSQSTVVRRRSNTKVLLSKLASISETYIQHIINNINWN